MSKLAANAVQARVSDALREREAILTLPKNPYHLSAEVRREQILAAAKRCLGRMGAKAFTMKMVVEEAGVVPSMISYHIDGIEGLFNALVDSIMLDEPSTKNLPPADLEGALENLNSLIDRHFDPNYYSRENLLVWLPVYEQMLLDEHVNATMSAREDRVIKEAAIHIDDIARIKGLTVDADQIAYDLVALLEGLWLAWCLSGREGTQQERRSAYTFLEAFLGPLRTTTPQ